MNLLLLKILRDLLREPWRPISLIFVLALGVGVLGAIRLALMSVPDSLHVFYGEHAFADLEIHTLPEDAIYFQGLENLEGVAALEKRLILPAQVAREGTQPLTSLLILTEDPSPRVNSLEYLEGGPHLAGRSQVTVERNLRAYHGFSAGKTIRYTVGEKEYRDTVAGVAISPEFFISIANPDFSIAEKGSLGVIFGNLDRLDGPLGFRLVNDLVFTFAPGADSKAVTARILEALKGRSIERVVPRGENLSHMSIIGDIERYRSYTGILIGILLAVALAVCLVSFHRLMVARAQETGVLRALGFSGAAIVSGFAASGALLGLAAGAAGTAVALAGRNLFATAYVRAMGMPEIAYTTDPRVLAEGALLAVGLGMLAGILPAATLQVRPVSKVVRAAAPGIMRRSVFFRSRYPGTFFPLAQAGRSLARKPWTTLATILATGMVLAVPFAYSICTTSNMSAIFATFDREGWQVAVDFLFPRYDDDLMSEIPASRRAGAVPYFRGYAGVEKGGKSVGVRILGTQAENPYRKARLTAGRMFRNGEAELVLSRDAAKQLGAGLDDEVVLSAGGRLRTFRIVGMTSDFFLKQGVIPYRGAQELFQAEGKATGIYLGGLDDETSAAAGLLEVGSITRRSEVLGRVRSMWKDFIRVVEVATGFSVVMAVVFISLVAGLSLMERKSEFATLLSLGYPRRRMAAQVAFEISGLLTASLCVAVPLGLLFASVLNAQMSEIWFQVPTRYTAADFVPAATASIAAVPVVVWFCLRALFSLDVGAELRKVAPA